MPLVLVEFLLTLFLFRMELCRFAADSRPFVYLFGVIKPMLMPTPAAFAARKFCVCHRAYVSRDTTGVAPAMGTPSLLRVGGIGRIFTFDLDVAELDLPGVLSIYPRNSKVALSMFEVPNIKFDSDVIFQATSGETPVIKYQELVFNSDCFDATSTSCTFDPIRQVFLSQTISSISGKVQGNAKIDIEMKLQLATPNQPFMNTFYEFSIDPRTIVATGNGKYVFGSITTTSIVVPFNIQDFDITTKNLQLSSSFSEIILRGTNFTSSYMTPLDTTLITRRRIKLATRNIFAQLFIVAATGNTSCNYNNPLTPVNYRSEISPKIGTDPKSVCLAGPTKQSNSVG